MANEYWPSVKRRAEYLRNINLADCHPSMKMKTYFSAYDSISFKQTVDRMPKMGCNDDM